MNLIVNLVSNQTIPNLQFLKKLYKQDDHLLFINTDKMNELGVVQWIITAFSSLGFSVEELHNIIIDEYNDEDIKTKLNSFDFDIYDRIFVNVTGGTKVMSLISYEFFKEKAAEIFYITGRDDELLKLFPSRNRSNLHLGVKINLEEYLSAYGFKTHCSSHSGKSLSYTMEFFDNFLKIKDEHSQYHFIKTIQNTYRGKTCNIAEVPGLESFFKSINYVVKNGVQLTKVDTKYLSGDWFEELIFHKIKSELDLKDDEICTGLHLIKNEVNNEFDVVFILENTLYVIECKTLIINKEFPSLVNDTFYKLSSLTNQLGLFCRKAVFTLNRSKDFKESHLNRAKELNIKIIGLDEIQSALFNSTLSELL